MGLLDGKTQYDYQNDDVYNKGNYQFVTLELMFSSTE